VLFYVHFVQNCQLFTVTSKNELVSIVLRVVNFNYATDRPGDYRQQRRVEPINADADPTIVPKMPVEWMG